jgi:exodeoxyribonuclease VII large subunit
MSGAVGAVQRLPILSVSDLTRLLRVALEGDFAEVWVAGEISSFRAPSSGHYYFCLKDRRSQIAAVMFRSAQRALVFRPRDGLEVIAHGRISLYEARGDLQLYVDTLEPRGVGGLQLALEQLKRRLAEEGLFDAARKRPLPWWPRAVGVVTALHGAALQDILTALRAACRSAGRRSPRARARNRRRRGDRHRARRCLLGAGVEVVVVGRGGGSIEDLWVFNEERVVRAIVACKVPVVSAVGHEIDLTLADLAADCRAATPTAAAALVVPDAAEQRRRVAVQLSDLIAASAPKSAGGGRTSPLGAASARPPSRDRGAAPPCRRARRSQPAGDAGAARLAGPPRRRAERLQR